VAAEAVSQGDAGGDGHRLSRHVEQIVQALIDSGIGLRRVGQREVSAGADWNPPRWHVDQDVRRRRATRQPGQQGRRPGSDVVVRVGDPTDDLPAESCGDVIAVQRTASPSITYSSSSVSTPVRAQSLVAANHRHGSGQWTPTSWVRP